jgi:hypothetical protein
VAWLANRARGGANRQAARRSSAVAFAALNLRQMPQFVSAATVPRLNPSANGELHCARAWPLAIF